MPPATDPAPAMAAPVSAGPQNEMEREVEACLQQCDRIAPSEAKQLLRALEGRLLDKVDAELDAQHDAQYLLLLVERVHARQESISLGGGGRGISSGGGSSRAQVTLRDALSDLDGAEKTVYGAVFAGLDADGTGFVPTSAPKFGLTLR